MERLFSRLERLIHPMPSLLEQLPGIVKKGKQKARQALSEASRHSGYRLETDERIHPVLPGCLTKGLPDCFSGSLDTLPVEMSFGQAFYDNAEAVALRNASLGVETSRLIHGDNLLAMAALLVKTPDHPGYRGKIDLIYGDPPFESNAHYELQTTLPACNGPGSASRDVSATFRQIAYQDKWHEGTTGYLTMLVPRLVLMRELLADTGSVYIHLDWHTGHYVKLVMDDIFGRENFRNELIWHYPDYLQGNVSKGFPRKNDFILFYSRTNRFYFNRVTEPLKTPKKRNKVFWNKTTGKMELLRDDNGKIIYQEHTAKYCDTVWQIGQTAVTRSQSKEFLPFETQKPAELLRRVIEASSPPGGWVADFFGGSGTTAAVAEALGRRWLLNDRESSALTLTKKRLVAQLSKPFLQQSFSFQAFQAVKKTFGRSGKNSTLPKQVQRNACILEQFGAVLLPAEQNTNGNMGALIAKNTLVVCVSPNEAVNLDTLQHAQCLRNTAAEGWEKVILLAWVLPAEIGQHLHRLNDKALEVLQVSETGAVSQGQVTPFTFSSVACLTVTGVKTTTDGEQLIQPKPQKKGKIAGLAETLLIELKQYQWLSPAYLNLDKKGMETLMPFMQQDSLALIEYWSIDPDYDGHVFNAIWQHGRSKENNHRVITAVELAGLREITSPRKVCIRVVDLLGLTTQVILTI